jgi:hypothetical protein
MGALRKLRREAGWKAGGEYAVEPLRATEFPPMRKMSEVLLDFARPLLDTVDDEGFKNVIIFAALCWNVSFLPEPKQQKDLKKIVDELSKPAPLIRPDLNAWAKSLLERKKAFFAADRRMVLDYRVVEEKDSRHLFVTSTLAKP